MGDIAHGVGAGGHREAEQALLLGDVEQFVLDPVTAIAGIDHAADDEEILLEQPPGRIVDLAAAGRAFDHVALGQAAELAGTIEVGTHHAGDIGGRRGAGTLVGHRHHRDRQRRGIAADDVDFQPLLLGHGRQRQQKGEHEQ